MKKLKLFVIGLCAMFVAVIGVRAQTTICTANDETAFENCVKGSDRIINVTGDYSLTKDYTVDNKRIVIDQHTLTIDANKTLRLENFKVDANDVDTYSDKTGKQINIFFGNTNSKLVVKGELIAESAAEGQVDGNTNTIAISGKHDNGGDGFYGVLEVDGGKVSISGYKHSALRPHDVTLKNGANLEVSNCGHGGNVLKVEVLDTSVYNSHDNDRGLTTNTLNASGNAKVTFENNNLSGLYASGTISDNAVVVSKNNGTEDVGITGNGLTLEDNATLETGSVVAPYGGANAKLNVASEGNVTLKVEHIADGLFGVPESGLTGVVRLDDVLHVYSVDNDTLELTLDDIALDGTVKVTNHIGKDLKVTTADSSVVKTLQDGNNTTYNLVKVTAKVEDEIAEGMLLLFKNQKFGELSETGKNKLDTMLAVEGKQIDSYVAGEDTVTDDYEVENDIVLTATYSNIPEPVIEKADTTELEKAIAEAEKYLDDKKYDAKEVEALKKIIEEAKGLIGADKEGQETVDAMVEVLKDAMTKVANTGDNIMSVVATGIASLAVIAGGIVLVRKNKFNN